MQVDTEYDKSAHHQKKKKKGDHSPAVCARFT